MKIVDHSSLSPQRGFSLIELMVTLAIIAILASIALPSCSEYITRSRLVDAHTRLGDLRIQMEKYFQDNRTYVNAGGACGITAGQLANVNADPSRSFDFTCPGPTATTYLLVATGRAAKNMTNFIFDVDQSGNKTSQGPAGWTAAPCWFVRKDGSCS